MPAAAAARAGVRRVLVQAGNYQAAQAGRPFSAQLSAVVVDAGGGRLAGVRVTFRVTSGAAAFAHGSRAATSTTGAGGIATSQVLAAGNRTGSVRVMATAGVGSRPAVFSLRVIAGSRRGVAPAARR